MKECGKQDCKSFNYAVSARCMECYNAAKYEPKPEEAQADEQISSVIGSQGIKEKPPLGLEPRKYFEERLSEIQKRANSEIEQAKGERIVMIIDAMKRYSEASKSIPIEWVDELRSLLYKGSFGDIMRKILA